MLHVLLDVAVRRREHAHVDGHLRRRADAAHLPLLQHAQELHLQRRAAARRPRRGGPCRRRPRGRCRACRDVAPVNAPFSWPKSSLSMSASGIAPQLTTRNGLSVRSDRSWIARAMRSLPVPLSPVMSTVVCAVGDALRRDRACAASRSEWPRMPRGPARARPARGGARSRRRASALLEGLVRRARGARRSRTAW